LLVVLALGGLLAPAARADTRHVLVLSSAERPFSPQSGFADSLTPELVRRSQEPIEFVEMSLQAARSSDLAPDAAIAQHLRSTFKGQPLDLVVTIGGPAASFAQQFRQQLFPTTPMLLAGVDRRFVEHGTFADSETTVATQHDPALMIDEMLRLLPDTQTVVVVIGASQIEQFWLKETQREFQRFARRVQFIWTNQMSLAEIVERCRTLPPHSAIFFALLSLDGKGEPHVAGKAFESVHAAANAPMFGLYRSSLGRGIVGGPLLSNDALTQATVNVALRILAGESPHAIKTPVHHDRAAVYDWRELRRWNIPENRLLPGSVVQFREPTTWQRYKHAIVFGGIAAGLNIGVCVVLLVGRVKRRRAGTSGTGTADGVPSVPANTMVRVWTASRDGRRVEAGQSPEDGENDAWTIPMHSEDVGRSVPMYWGAFARREPFQMEYRVRDAAGVERWLLDTGLPKFSGQEFEGYVGSTVDVTGLGRARAELSKLSRHLIQAHERERAAIAKKLHDDVCQRIVVLTLRLHGLKASPDDEGKQAVVDEISAQLATLASELSTVSDPVYRKIELLGLTATCRRLCDELSAQRDVTVHFQHHDVPANLPTDIALALFRVMQEATINAVIHSGARDVWVSLLGGGAEIRLEIADSGVGFDPQRHDRTSGVGLVAIRERLELVNGGSAIDSRPGEGTRLIAWVPLRPRDASEPPAAE
jgi:signal transduction histidine kinase